MKRKPKQGRPKEAYPQARRLLNFFLFLLTNKYKKFTLDQLTDKLDKGRRTVQRDIVLLTELGLIKREDTGCGEVAYWQLSPQVMHKLFVKWSR